MAGCTAAFSECWTLLARLPVSHQPPACSVARQLCMCHLNSDGAPTTFDPNCLQTRALWRFCRYLILTAIPFKLVNDAAQFVGPLFLNLLLNVVSSGQPSYLGYSYAILMFVLLVIGTLSDNQHFQRVMRAGGHGGTSCRRAVAWFQSHVWADNCKHAQQQILPPAGHARAGGLGATRCCQAGCSMVSHLHLSLLPVGAISNTRCCCKLPCSITLSMLLAIPLQLGCMRGMKWERKKHHLDHVLT